MSRTLVVMVVLGALTASGCGGGTQSSASTAVEITTQDTPARDVTAVLTNAVRRALRANYQLSTYVLWHNLVPASAQESTRGPALDGMRSAAAQRRQRGIRIRPLVGHLTILTIKLDPSFARATATTEAFGRVRQYRVGLPLGQAIAVHERARLVLHRLGRSQHFVVWRVTVLQ